MRSKFCTALFAIACVFSPSALADDAKAVKTMIGEYASAFNNKDADAVLGFWMEDCVHVDLQTGERTQGRAAIAADIREAFQTRPDERLLGQIDQVRFVKPDVASVRGQVSTNVPGQEPSLTDFSAILVLHNDKWMIYSIEESPSPTPVTSYDALRELAWLVGRWADETESSRIDNVFRWSENGAFLIRSFSADSVDGDAYNGTQVIGWDPRSLEIRSWTFNSDGSFGDATWSQNGDDWLIKSSQTLVDGQAASGTFVLSHPSEDELTLRLIGHQVEGEPQPTEQSVTVTRVADETADAAASGPRSDVPTEGLNDAR